MKEIFSRRSIRKFTAEPVSDLQLEKLLRAAMNAPSACNEQPWEFVVIRNRDTFREIRNTRSRFVSIMVLSALAVCFLAGLRATEPDMKRSADRYFDQQALIRQWDLRHRPSGPVRFSLLLPDRRSQEPLRHKPSDSDLR